MKENKSDRFMTKVMVFCWKHKFAIGLSTAMLGAYCYGAHNQEKTYKAQQKAIDEEKARQERIAQYEAEMKAYREDPANQLSCGGVVMDGPSESDAWNDMIDMTLVNTPLNKMGELGEAIKERLTKGANTGALHAENVGDILSNNPRCDVVLSIYPGNTEEPGES